MTGKRWQYGPGIISLTAAGTYSVFVALGHGKRRRRVCKTIADAKAWILAGTSAAPPDRMLLEDALRARGKLPAAVTLDEAARFWLSAHGADTEQVAISDAWEAYAAECRLSLRPRTFQGYRQAVAALIAHVGPSATTGSVTPGTIDAMLAGKPPSHRNGTLRRLSAFFSFAVRRRYATSNPAAAVAKAKEAEVVPAVFSPSEAAAVMSSARTLHPDTVPYFALCLFAGIRPEETLRVRASNIMNGYVVLDGKITKTRSTRTVRIRPNLAAWLDAYPIPDDGYVERHIKAVRASAPSWTADVCRHSFASYAYELTKDAAAVAAEMGHSGTDVFFRHYRALAAPGSGAEFFAISP